MVNDAVYEQKDLLKCKAFLSKSELDTANRCIDMRYYFIED